jgi:hypothetical protein
MIIGGIILHPVKKAVCEEILNLLNATDSTIRKDTVTSLRRPRYFYSLPVIEYIPFKFYNSF